MNNKWVLILLEEQNEHRGLAHIVSDEAFRYPPNVQEDNLYVVGHDTNGNIHFLRVEDGEIDEVTLRTIDDEELFNKLLNYYQDNSRLPICEKDEQLRRSIGLTDDSRINQTVAKLEISRI